MQVETLVEFEPDIDISSLIKKDIIQEIIEVAKKGFKNLKELKEKITVTNNLSGNQNCHRQI